jgi:hypothetical protein
MAELSYPNWIVSFNLENKSFMDIYLASFYFIIATMTSVGYGDIVCISKEETFFQIILLSIGLVAYSFIISTVGDYVKNKSTDYDSFMNEYGCYVFDNHIYGEPKFWFSIDKKGLLFFGYEEKLNKRTRVNIVYNSPISTGEKIIKDAISSLED